jgi:hypothetical protein
MIVLQPQKCWRLDYETRIEYRTFDLEDRDLDYENACNCKPHIVYLALSSEVKVGVTRKTQVPTDGLTMQTKRLLLLKFE